MEDQITVTGKDIIIPKARLYALIGSFAVTFLGSWIQLNQRISRMEAQVEYVERTVSKIGEMESSVKVIVEQNRWIQKHLNGQEEEIKEIRKTQMQQAR